MGDLYAPNIENEDSLFNSISHFADCIINNKKSYSDCDQAIRILEILEKADKSLKTGGN